MYGVIPILYAPFMIIVAMVMAWLRTPSLAWILIVVTVAVLIIMAFLVPKIFKAYDERQKRLDAHLQPWWLHVSRPDRWLKRS